jgi:hypothetical protein
MRPDEFMIFVTKFLFLFSIIVLTKVAEQRLKIPASEILLVFVLAFLMR